MQIPVTIELLTPIFIGDGESYYPSDCIVDSTDRKLKVIHKEKFLDKIYKDQNKYNQFLSISSGNNHSQLLSFIQTHGKDCVDYSVEISPGAFDYITRQTNLFRAPVDTFIKESFTKNPIIPGSTIKGILKTAVVNYILQKNSGKKSDYKHRLKSGLTGDKIASDLLGNFESDLFKLVMVSDFQFVSGNLKIIRPTNRGSKQISPMPILLESLSAGSTLKGSITIHSELISSKHKNTIFALNLFSPDTMSFIDALKLFAEDIVKEEASRFKVDMSKISLSKNESLIKIGKHAGAGSKSLTEMREIDIRAGSRLIRKDKYQSSLWITDDKQPIGWAIMKLGQNQEDKTKTDTTKNQSNEQVVNTTKQASTNSIEELKKKFGGK